ncbi:5'-deoxynucleotidase HDDC2 [Centruroides vittatus]|uniref:5'-deoxynucleotidase HDDC2 n=1 Tax=Centruroides vittatus TaxID=120091 RepID=UPI00350F4AEF
MPSKLIEFMLLIGKLKRVRRTGWVMRNVPDVESVADHMYRMGVLAMLLNGDDGSQPLDKDKCIKMSLVHDLAECIVGDITPHCGVSNEEKHEKEKAAMIHLTTLLDKKISEEIFALWKEYEEQNTPESRAVKDLDRFDMILQAYEYEDMLERPSSLEEFFNTTNGKFQNPQIIKWTEELYALRNTKKE